MTKPIVYIYLFYHELQILIHCIYAKIYKIFTYVWLLREAGSHVAFQLTCLIHLKIKILKRKIKNVCGRYGHFLGG